MSTALSERFDVISSRRHAPAYPAPVAVVAPTLCQFIGSERGDRGRSLTCPPQGASSPGNRGVLRFPVVSPRTIFTMVPGVVFTFTFPVVYIPPSSALFVRFGIVGVGPTLVIPPVFAQLVLVLFLPSPHITRHARLTSALPPIRAVLVLMEFVRGFYLPACATTFQTNPPGLKELDNE